MSNYYSTFYFFDFTIYNTSHLYLIDAHSCFLDLNKLLNQLNYFSFEFLLFLLLFQYLLL